MTSFLQTKKNVIVKLRTVSLVIFKMLYREKSNIKAIRKCEENYTLSM